MPRLKNFKSCNVTDSTASRTRKKAGKQPLEKVPQVGRFKLFNNVNINCSYESG